MSDTRDLLDEWDDHEKPDEWEFSPQQKLESRAKWVVGILKNAFPEMSTPMVDTGETDERKTFVSISTTLPPAFSVTVNLREQQTYCEFEVPENSHEATLDSNCDTDFIGWVSTLRKAYDEEVANYHVIQKMLGR